MKCQICKKEKRCMLTFPKNHKGFLNKLKKLLIGSTEYVCLDCLIDEGE